MNCKNEGKLDESLCYLSGPMEYAKDNGVIWRRKFIKLCQQKGLQIKFIDPTNKPGKEDSLIEEDKKTQIELQETGQFLKLKQYVSAYRRADLRFVDISDFLVALVDPNVHMCGTYNEIFTAEQQHKPIFFVCEGGLKKLPRWLFGVIDLDDVSKNKRCNVFENFEQVIEELEKINNGTLEMSHEWVLIRKYLENI